MHALVTTTAAIVLIDGTWRRPPELEDMVVALGYRAAPLPDLTQLPLLLRAGQTAAVIVGSRALGLKDLLAIRQARTLCPDVPIVMINASDASPTDLKRALDHGATAFLSWPCSGATLQGALNGARRGALAAGRESTEEPGQTSTDRPAHETK